jgi:alkylation response protein AidB-like acyl-CoA dehydrogenase
VDFSLSPEQQELRDAALAFARAELRDDVVRRDKEGAFSRELWQRCAAFGIQGLPFAEAYGGGGQDILTTVLAMEALGHGCRDNGLLFGLAAQMWSVQMPLARFGTEAQKQKYLTKLCTGEWVGAHGMSEPDSGSDAFAMRTLAEPKGDHYVLNGTKTFVSEAPVADVFVVFATVERGKGVLGVTGFLIEKDTPGFRVGKQIEKMGLKTSPMAELSFEDCVVPKENLLGREGRGAQVFNDSMEWERGLILASALGTMQRQVDECAKYTRERKQFGKPISQNQAVANKIVQMKVRLEAARLLMYRVAWLRQNNCPAAADTALAKLFVSESLVQSSLDAVQVHGGYGFTTEYEVERDLRDAIGSRLYSGTNEIQHTLVARSLGL